MSRYCLDTATYSQFKSGERRVAALLDAAEWIGIPAIVLGEVRASLAIERQFTELQEFLAAPNVEVVPVDAAVAAIFGEIVSELRREKRPLATNVIWIAATCIHAGAALITWDVRFRAIPRLECLVLTDVRADSARPS